jgi:ATP-dependent Clp protease ATP-binding subunit ClpA
VRLRRRQRKPQPPRRVAEHWIAAGATEARRLGHHYVGTEHLLLAITRSSESTAAVALNRLGVSGEAIRTAIEDELGVAPPAGIDPAALATLGIDLDAVRKRLEETFGEGALEQTRRGCMGVTPRAKQALERALREAGGRPVGDEHLLLGLLAISGGLAACILGQFGVHEADIRGQLAA